MSPEPLAGRPGVAHPVRAVRRRISLLVLLVVTGLSGCATSGDATWIHPDTGRVPPPAAESGAR